MSSVRLPSSGGLAADGYFGGAQQAVFQAVAALVQGADQAGFHIIPLFIGNGIMDIGVEGFAHFPGDSRLLQVASLPPY